MHPFIRNLVAAGLTLLIALPAWAASLIRDPDIEHALKELARPVLTAAGLSADRVKILLINDSSLNAFVLDHQHIFIHTGLLLKMKRAEMLQSVIAHEAAHIANGHISRRQQNLRNANTITGLGIALAAAVAASGNAQAAGGLGVGIASSANRAFLSHTRAEESAADSSGLRYMARAGVDPKGYSEVLEIFKGQEYLRPGRQDPYAQTHPLTRDRLRAVEAQTTAYEGRGAPSPTADYWFARAQGKLFAFQRAPKSTLRRAKKSPSKDIQLLQTAVAYHRMPNAKKALSAMNQLIALRPKDPYLHELHGQILLESRQAKSAVGAYRRAANLAPRNALILGGYGRALLATGQPKAALAQLEKSRSRDFRNAHVLRDLATAYAKTGNKGMASLVTAERYALQGRLKDAQLHAKRASGLLPRGSAPWLRSQDVLSAAQVAKKKRR